MKVKTTCCLNPYPALGGPALPLSWPRGFPLDSILNMDTFQGTYMLFLASTIVIDLGQSQIFLISCMLTINP